MRLWRWVEIPPVALESAVKISGSGMSTVLKMAPDNKEGVIFWQGHLPMRRGIYEAEDCQNNRIIHNNINYYT